MKELIAHTRTRTRVHTGVLSQQFFPRLHQGGACEELSGWQLDSESTRFCLTWLAQDTWCPCLVASVCKMKKNHQDGGSTGTH